MRRSIDQDSGRLISFSQVRNGVGTATIRAAAKRSGDCCGKPTSHVLSAPDIVLAVLSLFPGRRRDARLPAIPARPLIASVNESILNLNRQWRKTAKTPNRPLYASLLPLFERPVAEWQQIGRCRHAEIRSRVAESVFWRRPQIEAEWPENHRFGEQLLFRALSKF